MISKNKSKFIFMQIKLTDFFIKNTKNANIYKNRNFTRRLRISILYVINILFISFATTFRSEEHVNDTISNVSIWNTNTKLFFFGTIFMFTAFVAVPRIVSSYTFKSIWNYLFNGDNKDISTKKTDNISSTEQISPIRISPTGSSSRSPSRSFTKSVPSVETNTVTPSEITESNPLSITVEKSTLSTIKMDTVHEYKNDFVPTGSTTFRGRLIAHGEFKKLWVITERRKEYAKTIGTCYEHPLDPRDGLRYDRQPNLKPSEIFEWIDSREPCARTNGVAFISRSYADRNSDYTELIRPVWNEIIIDHPEASLTAHEILSLLLDL